MSRWRLWARWIFGARLAFCDIAEDESLTMWMPVRSLATRIAHRLPWLRLPWRTVRWALGMMVAGGVGWAVTAYLHGLTGLS